jgi:putative hemolysin
LEFIDFVINKLSIKYSVQEEFGNKIPASGPFIIIANHPLGGIDGLKLLILYVKSDPT